jgi:hypothetical protein
VLFTIRIHKIHLSPSFQELLILGIGTLTIHKGHGRQNDKESLWWHLPLDKPVFPLLFGKVEAMQ